MADPKPIVDHQRAAERFYSEVGTNNVNFYDVDSFTNGAFPSVYPSRYLDKCTRVVVAVSGSKVEGHDWIAICPYRVDQDKTNQRMVFDLDPMILTFDPDAFTASPVAFIGYHQNFTGRTSPIEGIPYSNIFSTVSQLRTAVTTGQVPLSATPLEVASAIGHMAEYFRRLRGP